MATLIPIKSATWRKGQSHFFPHELHIETTEGRFLRFDLMRLRRKEFMIIPRLFTCQPLRPETPANYQFWGLWSLLTGYHLLTLKRDVSLFDR